MRVRRDVPSQNTVEEIVDRAARPDFDRWAEQVARCGHCSRPVRLRERIEHRSADGRRVAYTTEAEPDRVLMVRCGNRRATVCPSCSYEYAGDMWQLLYASAAGGRKGVPESIRSHPLVGFTTSDIRSCASCWNWAPRRTWSRIARHADLDVTMRIYAHTNLDTIREALDKIDWGAE